nr:unnamed protein product [Callosobruchus chinensis]
MKNKKKRDIFRITYIYLAFLRVVLVFVPQIGYIHPDEFFQSVEVLIGKFLDVENSPPWEFDSAFPIRSMTVPYFTIGMCIKFLRDISNIGKAYLPNFTLLTPYSLLVAPRVLMCIFSFSVDFCLYKICLNNNESYKARLIILSSSYVMLVYGTRTFSNSIELYLFAILLYFVSESMTFSNILLRKKEYVNFRYEKSKTLAEKARFHKLKLFMASDSYRNCFYISTIAVIGFFNRPTFLAFAVIPIFFWLYRGIGSKTVTVLQFHARILVLIFCAIPSIVFCITIDSFYYSYITWGEIGVLDVSINNFVFTPLNFVRYNIDPKNLAKHGLHPRYLHLLVNVPLLYNILGLCAMETILRYIYLCYRKKFNHLPTVRSIKCLMIFSAISPLALLSIFPHQEPRFLIPLIVPLVYLHSHFLLPEPESSIIEAPRIHPADSSKASPPTYRSLKFWIISNAVLALFYGFLHQGGVVQATSYLAQDMRVTAKSTEYHIVTSHIYSLPESIFVQPSTNKLYKKGKTQFSVAKRVYLYEQGSQELDYVILLLNTIVTSLEADASKRSKVYLLISSSLDDKLRYLIGKQYLNFFLVESFYPHLSLESFPDLGRYCTELTEAFYSKCVVLSHRQYFWQILRSFGLNLYQVTMNKF